MARATQLAHDAIRHVLKPGDTAVDATIGNGHDTVFLAELVGSAGKVIGFDVQAAAIASTSRRLQESGLARRVSLHHLGHENLAQQVSQAKVVMFNLGYLPGGDHEKITRTETTLQALEAGLSVLLPGGLITCVCYPGHDGGEQEADAVKNWVAGLTEDQFVSRIQAHSDPAMRRPFLIEIWRIEPLLRSSEN